MMTPVVPRDKFQQELAEQWEFPQPGLTVVAAAETAGVEFSRDPYLNWVLYMHEWIRSIC